MTTIALTYKAGAGIVLLAILASAVFSQPTPIPSVSLSRPDASLPSGFTRVSGVRELGDRRVIVVDEGDSKVFLIDSTLASVATIGRAGDGPGEYRSPSRVFAFPGDSSAVLDRSNSRLLIITPHGKPGGTLDARWDRFCAGKGGVRLRPLAGTDALRRFYSQAEPIIPSTDGGLRPADSAAVERWTTRCDRDTLAFIPSPGARGARIVGGMVMGGEPQGPFPEQTQWAVASDGRVAIVRPQPYRVDFVDKDGRRRDGIPIRFERVRVTDSIKQQWRAERQQPRRVTMVTRDGSSSRPIANLPYKEPAAWPEYLAPFPSDAVSFARDGRLWVRRTTPSGQPPTYDVIDDSGRLREQVRLPLRSRIVGFGDGVLYVVRIDQDDVEHLERYRLPAR